MKWSSIEAAQNGQLGKEVVTVEPQTSLQNALAAFETHNIHHLVVCEGEKIVGLVSPRTLVSALQLSKTLDLSAPVRSCMLKDPPVLTEDQDVSETLATMRKVGATALPIVLGGKLVGIVTETDLLFVFEEMINESADDFHLNATFQSVMANPVIQNMMKLLGDAGI